MSAYPGGGVGAPAHAAYARRTKANERPVAARVELTTNWRRENGTVFSLRLDGFVRFIADDLSGMSLSARQIAKGMGRLKVAPDRLSRRALG
jgi:hypothetical protein